VITHGFTAVKEMLLGVIAARFNSSLAIPCLVYDHRGLELRTITLLLLVRN
jgi:hypothetical protein